MKSFTFKCSNLLPCLLHHILLDRLQTHLLPLPGLLSRPLPLLRKHLFIYWTWALLCFTLGGGRLVIAWMVLGHFFPMFKWTFSWVGGVKAIWALQKHMRTFLLVLPLHSPVATSLPLPISSISTTSISFSNILQVCEKAACRCSRQSSGLQRQERPHGMIDGPMQAGWKCTYQPGNFSWFYSVLIRLASKTKINLTIIRQWQIR